MQTLGWYWRRLRAMGPGEIAWRARSMLANQAGRFRIDARAGRAAEISRAAARQRPTRPLRFDAARIAELRDALPPERITALEARARSAAQGRLTLLGGETLFCGNPIDWHRDHKHQVATPRGYAPAIDYRDFREVGDCKWVWEPARCAHFVVLARAFRLCGDLALRDALVAQWRDWIAANPYGRGMHWRSPLELGVRLIHWTWAYALAEFDSWADVALRAELLASIELHCDEIARHYSRGSSANNHLIGELAGVYVASAYFSELPASMQRHTAARALLAEECARQTLADGANCELATGYHAFVLQFFIAAEVVARGAGASLGLAFTEKIEAMARYLDALLEGGAELPLFNDADDGFVLDVARDPRDPRPWVAVAGAFRGDPPPDHDALEACVWACGTTWTGSISIKPRAPRALESRAFPHAGVHLLQHGVRGDAEAVSVAFDCGPLGFGAIAAHGHADALSFTLRIGGREVLCDSGTFDYFTYPDWRNYLRSTAAHNTATVDGLDQSELQGLFLWGRRAQAQRNAWTPSPTGGTIRAQHDGYRRLPDPVTHIRTLTLDGAVGSLDIEDTFETKARHEIALHLHCAPHVRPEITGPNTVELDLGDRIATLEVDARLRLEALRAEASAPIGWISRGYHQRAPGTTLRASAVIVGTTTFTTRLRWSGRTTADSMPAVLRRTACTAGAEQA